MSACRQFLFLLCCFLLLFFCFFLLLSVSCYFYLLASPVLRADDDYYLVHASGIILCSNRMLSIRCCCCRNRLSKGQFTLRDMYKQLSSSLKMGPMSKVMSMIPGMSEMSQVREGETDRQMDDDLPSITPSVFFFFKFF